MVGRSSPSVTLVLKAAKSKQSPIQYQGAIET
jgi:hypothetical protein